MFFLWVLACGSAVHLPVSVAVDVPPPPGQQSLDLGPTDLDCEPGAEMTIDGVTASIVDCRDGFITVYVDEGPAQPWLEAGFVEVQR